MNSKINFAFLFPAPFDQNIYSQKFGILLNQVYLHWEYSIYFLSIPRNQKS